MKNLIALVALTLAPITAFAHSGSNHLACHSVKGAKQYNQFSVSRPNGGGEFPGAFTLIAGDTKTDFTTEDESKPLGETIHNSPLGVILVTANNLDIKDAPATGYFSVTAIPSTVKAYDGDKKRVKWSLELEKDECGDANGRATFKGIFRGYMYKKNHKDEDVSTNFEAEIMDCELEYNPGMAC